MMEQATMKALGNGAGVQVAPGRSCGKCSMCCKLLHVIELNKPANKWCEHCRPGYGGCSIYDTRPSICRDFGCGWLMSPAVAPEWYPLLSHMILALAPFNGVLTCTVTVDPNFPWMWKEQPYYSQLKQMAYNGLHVKSADDILLVHVRLERRVWLLLPDEDIEITNGSYIIKAVANGQWGVEQFATQTAAAERVRELMNQPAATVHGVPPT
jgi:hypothetical protein